jgi:hypothetical protein
LDITGPRKSFHEAESEIGKMTIKAAKEFCQNGRTFRAFIESKLKKATNFEIVDMTNFQGIPQAMEPEVRDRMSARWVEMPQIRDFVDRKDGFCISDMYRVLSWALIEKLDRNHVVKAFIKRLENLKMINVKSKWRNVRPTKRR